MRPHCARAPTRQDASVHPELARTILIRNGSVRLRVRGGSMGPWIRSGDEVLVVPAVDAYVGELIAFASGTQIVTHRVRSVLASGWVTQGDANLEADGLVSRDRLIGRVAGLHARSLRLERPPRGLAALAGRAMGAVARRYAALRRRRRWR